MYIPADGCQYECNQPPGKTCLDNNLLRVDWKVKICSLPPQQSIYSTVSNPSH